MSSGTDDMARAFGTDLYTAPDPDGDGEVFRDDMANFRRGLL